MVFNTKIEKEVKIERYQLLRAIRDDGIQKTVISEKEFLMPPSISDIASFLDETKSDFVSVVENFRLCDDEIPFN